MIGYIIIILLLCILCVICDIKSILKKENKNIKRNKDNEDTSFINIVSSKTQEQIDKELEMQERQNWQPNKKLFVTKEMKEQIFGN